MMNPHKNGHIRLYGIIQIAFRQDLS